MADTTRPAPGDRPEAAFSWSATPDPEALPLHISLAELLELLDARLVAAEGGGR